MPRLATQWGADAKAWQPPGDADAQPGGPTGRRCKGLAASSFSPFVADFPGRAGGWPDHADDEVSCRDQLLRPSADAKA